MHKILVMLLYYERPQMVRSALRSVVRANQHYQNWVLGVYDDGSPTHVLPIVREEMGGLMDKVRVFRCDMTPDEKKRIGCYLGLGMNTMIQRTDADVGVMLCDDDELYPDYLKNLDAFFTAHPEAEACYSHVVQFDPLTEDTNALVRTPEQLAVCRATPAAPNLNSSTEPINPVCRLDASQVAWRLSVNKDRGVWFKYPCSRDHDANFYQKLYERTGPVPFSGCVGQYKGVHSKQLGKLDTQAAWVGGAALIDRPPA